MQDIFESNFSIPNDTVCICGSGSEAPANYHKVKDDAWYMIAVNGAIGMPLRFDAWGITDPRAMECGYFKEYSGKFQGIYFIAHHLAEKFRDFKNRVYTFDATRGMGMKRPQYIPLDKHIKMGGTVAGSMLQIAYWFGEHDTIRLLGVQLTVKDYYDGTQSSKNFTKKYSSRNNLNAMVKYLVEEEGYDIKSLNETFLDIEVI